MIGSPEPSVIRAAKAQVSASVCPCICVCVFLSLSCLSLCVPLSLYLLLPLSFSLSLSFSPPPSPPPHLSFHFFFHFFGGGGAWGEIICPQRCFVIVSFLGQDYYLLVPGTAAVSDAHPFSFSSWQFTAEPHLKGHRKERPPLLSGVQFRNFEVCMELSLFPAPSPPLFKITVLFNLRGLSVVFVKEGLHCMKLLALTMETSWLMTHSKHQLLTYLSLHLCHS